MIIFRFIIKKRKPRFVTATSIPSEGVASFDVTVNMNIDNERNKNSKRVTMILKALIKNAN